MVDEVFDYVVVGGGAAGATLAARLAEHRRSVLLLEAGADPAEPAPGLPEHYEVPAFHALSTENPAMAWNFYVRYFGDDAARRRHLGGAPPPGALYPRASTLGGCGAHNALLFLATPDADWDDIADVTGDNSWRASAMRRHFQSVDGCRYRPLTRRLAQLSGGALNPGGHGYDGWLANETPLPAEALEDPALVRELRTVLLADFNSGPLARLRRALRGGFDPNDARAQGRDAEGVILAPLSTDGGRRVGARERALRAQAEHGLRIEYDALATRVIIENGVARGVEYRKGRNLYRASPLAGGRASVARVALARRETILCGGAFNSPQLLMLSGVGPPEALDEAGLTAHTPSPGVGANLQDRYEISLVHKTMEPWACKKDARFTTDDPLYAQWRQGRGLYTTNGGALACRFRSRASEPRPDLAAVAYLTRFDGYYPGYSRRVSDSKSDLSVALLKAYTHNRAGQVRLASADPFDPPRIDFRFFAEGADRDIAALIAGVRRLREALRPLVEGRRLAPEDTPGAALHSDAELDAFIRAHAWGHHASCTCAIGRFDQGGVLDSRFRVHGLANLRVVDASSFPRIPGYFIVSAVYTIAEKAAFDILRG